MGRYCPMLKRKVTYLDCMDCDDKICENDENAAEKEQEGDSE